MSEIKTHELRVREVRLELRIEAPVERVWQALTAELGAWWPRSFTTGPARHMVLEPRVGGRLYEDDGGGDGLVWATVTACRSPRSLVFLGDLTPSFGGPARNILDYGLAADPDGDATVVTVVDTTWGVLDPASDAGVEAGWQQLHACLKAYAEGRPLPEPAVADAPPTDPL